MLLDLVLILKLCMTLLLGIFNNYLMANNSLYLLHKQLVKQLVMRLELELL